MTIYSLHLTKPFAHCSGAALSEIQVRLNLMKSANSSGESGVLT